MNELPFPDLNSLLAGDDQGISVYAPNTFPDCDLRMVRVGP